LRKKGVRVSTVSVGRRGKKVEKKGGGCLAYYSREKKRTSSSYGSCRKKTDEASWKKRRSACMHDLRGKKKGKGRVACIVSGE